MIQVSTRAKSVKIVNSKSISSFDLFKLKSIFVHDSHALKILDFSKANFNCKN